MGLSTKLEKDLITPISTRITSAESVNTSQATSISNNSIAISNITNNTVGYQTAAQVTTAVNTIKGNPPTAFNTLEKIAAVLPYVGASPYPYTQVMGSRWVEYDSNNIYRETWFWNGTYWLSVDRIGVTFSLNSSATVSTFFSQPQIDTPTGIVNANMFLLNLKVDFLLSALSDGSNNWKLQFHSVSSTGSFTEISTDDLTPVTSNIPGTVTRTYNSVLDFSGSGIKFLRLQALETGTPAPLIGSALLTYRRVRI